MKQKRMFLLINLILLQIFSILIASSFSYFKSMNLGVLKYNNPDKYFSIMVAVITLVSLITIYLVKELFYLNKQEVESQIANQKLIDSQEMIQTLKANQHDFINHLQVISLAAQMGDTELINTYTKKVVKQVRELDVLTKLKIPEVSALIYSKIAEAEEFEIKVSINVNTNLQGINVEATDLVRILGNLLANAIYALKEVSIEERNLNITLFEDEKILKFIIANLRPVIPQEIMQNFFKQGFTTKGDQGNGFGLYNVKNIVKKYHGDVTVSSDINNGTVFEVLLPKI